MQNRIILLSTFFLALGLTSPPVLAQPAATTAWTLPHNTSVINTAPRTYLFSVIYYTAKPTGQIIQRQRVQGDYTRGLPHQEVEWNNVTVATADGDTAPFAAAQKQSFMDGFRYSETANSMTPDFFKSFPSSAVMQRNLVWDTEMFDAFSQHYLDKLKLNEPLHVVPGHAMNLSGLGSFQNHDVTLEYIGRSRRNGQPCALIEYRAFFNPVRVATGGVTLNARSDYWGTIWVSLTTRLIEYGTLYEEVTGQMKLPNQSAPQPLSVFRIGSLTPLPATH
jgi:hypothetical protein